MCLCGAGMCTDLAECCLVWMKDQSQSTICRRGAQACAVKTGMSIAEQWDLTGLTFSVQAYELPSQMLVWSWMRDESKDTELKKEAVILNHLTKSIVVTFKTERHAKTAYDFLMRKKVIFKAPKVCVPCRHMNCLHRPFSG